MLFPKSQSSIIDISPSPKLQPTQTASFATPTPAKRRKTDRPTTREDLDTAQMVIWDLKNQQMIEKHQAHMDTLDLIRTVIQQQSAKQISEQTMGFYITSNKLKKLIKCNVIVNNIFINIDFSRFVENSELYNGGGQP